MLTKGSLLRRGKMRHSLYLLSALIVVISVGICSFHRPPSYPSGKVESQIKTLAPKLISALHENGTFNHTPQGYQSIAPAPQAPNGLKPVESRAWTAFAQLHPASDLVPTFPEHYSEGMHVRGDGMAILLKPLGSNSASAQIENGKLVYHNAYTSTDSLNVVSDGRSEEFLLLRDARAPKKFEYDLSAVTGVKEIHLSDSSVHFTNAQGQRLQIEAPYLIENGGQKVANAVQWQISYPNGPAQPRLALVVNNAAKLRYPVVIDPTWVLPINFNLNTARYNHTCTLLPNGQVLAAGGSDASGNPIPNAELYNPATGTWTPTGSLHTARYAHTATLLPNGLVLVAGGYGFSGALPNAELYNPATGIWSATGNLKIARFVHTATLLPGGKVLVAAGADLNSASLASSELYTPSTGTWSLTTGNLKNARKNHTATLLANGQVLVAGGNMGPNGSTVSLGSCELYNPATGLWVPTMFPLNTARYDFTATLLTNGQVLVVGGVSFDGSALGVVPTAELYDPTKGTWTNTQNPAAARYLQDCIIAAKWSGIGCGWGGF